MAAGKNRLIIGDQRCPILTLENDTIRSVSGILSCNLVGEELPDDTIEAVLDAAGSLSNIAPLDYADGITAQDGTLLAVADNIADAYMQIPHGTPVWYFIGNNCIGEFFLEEIKRTGRTQFTLSAQSIIGVMDTHTYYGRMCNGEPLREIVEHIMLTNGMRKATTAAIKKAFDDLSWGPDVDNLPVYGWIPVCSKRVALYHVLFAYGLSLIRAEDGTMMITYIFSSASAPISDAAIYDGGSVTIPDRAQRVDVVEHSYQKMSGSTEIFNNEDETTDGEYIITFKDAPIQSSPLYCSGGIKIVASCPNAAIVTGSGKIIGTPFSHTERTISRGASNADDGKSVKVEDAYMVTMDTSDALLEKLWRYYTARVEVDMDIVLSNERLGQNYSYLNPYRETESGYLSEIKISASATPKCTAKLIAGYVPATNSGRLGSYILLTGSGMWEVPEEVFQSDTPRIRVVLIGGGAGGASGLKGKSGKARKKESSYNTTRNSAGADGDDGTPGKILEVTIEGSSLKREYLYSCGHGGTGGEISYSETDSNPGELGSDTAFGEYSSGDGMVTNAGIKNMYTGKVYAKAFAKGSHLTGDSGYKVQKDNSLQIVPGGFACGYDAKIYSPGSPDGTYVACEYDDGTWHARCTALPGDPGGAGVGENGKAPGKSSISGGRIKTGNGGNGGNSTVKPASRMDQNHDAYGYGGIGGYGGGGGGDTGFCNFPSWPWTVTAGTPGEGGCGGPGGDGCPGAIIVYY